MKQGEFKYRIIVKRRLFPLRLWKEYVARIMRDVEGWDIAEHCVWGEFGDDPRKLIHDARKHLLLTVGSRASIHALAINQYQEQANVYTRIKQ